MWKFVTTLLLPIIITIFLEDIEGLRPTTGALTNQQLPETALARLRELYVGCDGTIKGCFGFPENCINDFLDNANSTNPPVCRVFVSWAQQRGNNVFNMAGLPSSNNGYIALGLSEDASMGQDSVVGCYVDPWGNTGIARSVNQRLGNVGLPVPNYGFVPGPTAYDGGYIFCQFSQTNHQVTGDVNININFANSYHYLLAEGATGNANYLVMHSDDGKAASPEPIHITDTGIVGGRRHETDSDNPIPTSMSSRSMWVSPATPMLTSMLALVSMEIMKMEL